MREDATFQIFAKCLEHEGPWGVVVALAVELACAGQLMPGLKMLTNGLVQQHSLGAKWVVELGFAAR